MFNLPAVPALAGRPHAVAPPSLARRRAWFVAAALLMVALLAATAVVVGQGVQSAGEHHARTAARTAADQRCNELRDRRELVECRRLVASR